MQAIWIKRLTQVSCIISGLLFGNYVIAGDNDGSKCKMGQNSKGADEVERLEERVRSKNRHVTVIAVKVAYVFLQLIVVLQYVYSLRI